MAVSSSKNNSINKFWSRLNGSSERVGSKDRVFFLENLATLIRSGMPMTATLEAIQREAKSEKMKRIIAKVQAEIDSGVSFTEAVGKYNFLPSYSMSLIKAGERSGRFVENLQVIVGQQSKDMQFAAKLRGAMIYPVIVLVVAVVVGLGLSWFVLPKLTTVFEGMNVALPFTTRALIAFGKFIGKYGAIVVPTFLLVFLTMIYFLFIYPKSRFIGQRFIMHLPGFRQIVFESEMARFGYLLGTLLGAGLPILDSLSALKESSSYQDYRNLYAHLQDGVEEGFSFEHGFATHRNADHLMPPAVQQIITTGEKSGNLAEALKNIGTVYEAKIDISSNNLSALLEPALLVVIFAGVMLLALSVIQPVYGLLGGLDK